MTYYRRVGDVPRKRHIVHRAPDGSRYLEELMGTEGFSRASSLLYHRNSPSALLSLEPLDTSAPTGQPTLGSPLHLRTSSLSTGSDVVRDRTVLMANSDVRLAIASGTGTSTLYRNSFGDELVYVQEGSAVLESVFGALAVRAGDYVVIPAGTTHRWVSEGDLRMLVFDASGHVRPPKRYLSPDGQFLEATPYCERDIRGPDEPLLADDPGPAEVLVRTREGLALHCYAHHPFDVAGWDGFLYPWALSIHDFEPIVGSLHQPPPVHQTFEGPNFVICSFVPRPYDFHPEAVKIPYHHANVDSDEVIFYADGDFMSRAGAGIGVGSITLHPAGFTHGPQPGSWEKSLDKDRTSELAVMLDTFRPLDVTDAARAIADDNYLRSWL